MRSPSRIPASLPAALAALSCLVLSWSCHPRPVSGFPWVDQRGGALSFAQTARWPEGAEGIFKGSAAENGFRLETPLSMPEGSAIAVELSHADLTEGVAEAPRVSLTVSYVPKDASVTRPILFPLLSQRVRLILRVEGGKRVSAISAKSEAGTGFRIEGVSIVPEMTGIEEAEGLTVVSSGFRLEIGRATREMVLERPFADLVAMDDAGRGGARAGVVIRYGKAEKGDASSASDSIRLEAFREGGSSSAMTLRMSPEGGVTVLGADLFPPDTARIVATMADSRSVNAFYATLVDRDDYELADLGRVLLGEGPGEGEDYSLYRWDALPSVLVLDFKDYEAQDRYLKRLAFFVEKKGYRGSLQTDAVIGPLHGWNAHDYRMEDVAAFFERARSEAFPLSDQERALEDLLERRGMIALVDGKVEPGVGALISISRESPPALRRTLLVHESTHGVFFADAAYRDFVRRAWASIGDDEKWFWKAYFSWAAYDTSSEYLMANEFQAYLLQQPLSAAKEYFTRRKPDELLASHPELEDRVGEYLEKYGETFEKRARDLEAWLYRKYGFRAGKTYFLESGS